MHVTRKDINSLIYSVSLQEGDRCFCTLVTYMTAKEIVNHSLTCIKVSLGKINSWHINTVEKQLLGKQQAIGPGDLLNSYHIAKLTASNYLPIAIPRHERKTLHSSQWF